MKKKVPLTILEQPLPSLFAGCDEAGRGCLAGPVVASAIILPEKHNLLLLEDSKKLTAKERERAAQEIKREIESWAIGCASVAEIDQYNILQATFLAMHRAIKALALKSKFAHLLVDGNRFKPYPGLLHRCIVQGDALVPAISAASILAKTERDRIMVTLSQKHPNYGWEKNKGYPTKKHREAIKKHGCTVYHRRSFNPCQETLFS